MKCPKCGKKTEQEMVDVGVGEIPCGPHRCDDCRWVEPEPVWTKAPDPVHEHEGKWYFWNEVWADRYGPYDTEEEAQKACQDHAETL